MKRASIILTLLKPFNFLKQSASNSLLSGWAASHWFGGCSHLSQPRQKWRLASRGIPTEISVVSLIQSKQIARPLLLEPSIGVPQLQQRIL